MRTIAAVSTPRGKGGVALIRISGDDAVAVAEKVAFRPNGIPLGDTEPNRAVRTLFCKNGQPFDDGMTTVFRAPRSYTGEDTVELSCHGGPLVTRTLLTQVFLAGASPAGPGEFTRRAFQNGKITLSQAEAVGGLIDAKTDRQLEVSVLQCGGSLSAKLSSLSDRLTRLLASVYAYIDYPDEDMTDVPVPEMKKQLEEMYTEVCRLCATRAYGKAVSDGIKTVIVGKPNTGKSTLLNLLAGEDRAIVTEEAGTTRDVIKEEIVLGDYLLELSDTAGLRESGGRIEKLGMERSVAALNDAELVFAVFDGSAPPDEEDRLVLSRIREAGKEPVTVCVMNKADLGVNSDPPLPCFVRMSAASGKGREELEAAVRKLLDLDMPSDPGEILVNARQFAALEKTRVHLENALETLSSYTQDMAGLDLEQALAALGEADGRSVSEAVVNEIFSHFCVGK